LIDPNKVDKMGATQAQCVSIERSQPCGLIKAVSPVNTIGRSTSSTAKSISKSTSNSKNAAPAQSLWAKCKDAVQEFRGFQAFLMKQYSSPNHAFDSLFNGEDSPEGRNVIVRKDFIRRMEKAGFKGDTGVVFAMLKDGKDDFITRESFKQRLRALGKAKGDKGDKFLVVVGQAVAAAALENQGLGKALENFEHARGRSVTFKKSSSGRSNASVSTAASTNPSRRESRERETSKDSKQSKETSKETGKDSKETSKDSKEAGKDSKDRRISREREGRTRSKSNVRSNSPSPPGRRRRSSGQSKPPEPKAPSYNRQKSR